jgi:hypothetical protein
MSKAPISLMILKICMLKMTRYTINSIGNNLLAEFAMKAIEKRRVRKDNIHDFFDG